MTSTQNVALRLGAIALALLAAPVARAAVFTVSSPVSFTLGNGALVDVAPASTVFTTTDLLVEDPVGGVVPASDDIFVATITLRAGSAPVDEIQIAASTDLFFLGPKAAASLNDLGVPPSSVVADNLATLTGTFGFSPNLAAGETTVRLLVAYDTVGEMQDGDTVNFLISTGAGDETVQATILVGGGS